MSLRGPLKVSLQGGALTEDQVERPSPELGPTTGRRVWWPGRWAGDQMASSATPLCCRRMHLSKSLAVRMPRLSGYPIFFPAELTVSKGVTSGGGSLRSVTNGNKEKILGNFPHSNSLLCSMLLGPDGFLADSEKNKIMAAQDEYCKSRELLSS